ncbi:hypothetical protein EJ110_NYTH19264 [Nymphaea thermarum]|nr:hypothetical protein EJ110_NYTH19264 [Nymphaea thermarum]
MPAAAFFTTTQFLLFFFSLSTIILGDANIQEEVPKPPAQGTEKVSHLHFYFRDSLDGRYSIRIAAAPPSYKSATQFGTARVVDSPLTEGPDHTGLFRLARGYVQAKTYLYNVTNGLSIVEYDAFVMHY